MIRGITFSEQAFYSADFAHYQNFFMAGKNGITKGCSITNDGAQITIGTGYFLVQGRMMNAETETVVTSSSGFKDGYNRLVYTIDLSRTNTVSEFNQGYLEVLHDETLVQEDLEAGGLKYQYPLCNFQWNGSAISSFNIEAASISIENVFAAIEANFEVTKAEQEAWFASQKASFIEFFNAQESEILQMIADLQGQGFASYAELNEVKASKENKATFEQYTILASGWNAETKIYSFESAYPYATYDIEIELDGIATEAQKTAWGDASLVSVFGANSIKAFGDVPTVDIPIILKKVVK